MYSANRQTTLPSSLSDDLAHQRKKGLGGGITLLLRIAVLVAVLMVGTFVEAANQQPNPDPEPRLQAAHGLLGLTSVSLTDQLVVAANPADAVIWNRQTGLMVRRLATGPSGDGKIAATALTPDSVHAAAVVQNKNSDQDTSQLIIWRIADGREVHRVKLPDRMVLAAMCSVPTRQELRVAVVPEFDDKGGYDTVHPGQILDVDVASGAILQRIGVAPNTAAVAFSQDCGARYATARRIEADPESGEDKWNLLIRTHTGELNEADATVIPQERLDALALSPDGSHAAILLGGQILAVLDMATGQAVAIVERPTTRIRPADPLSEIVDPFRAVQFTGKGQVAVSFNGKVATFPIPSAFSKLQAGDFPTGAKVVEVDPLGRIQALALAARSDEQPPGSDATTAVRFALAGESGSITLVTDAGQDGALHLQKLWDPERTGTAVRDVVRLSDDEFVLMTEGSRMQRFALNRPAQSLEHDSDKRIDWTLHLPDSQELLIATTDDVRSLQLLNGHTRQVPDRPRNHEVQQTVLGDNSFLNNTMCFDVDPKGERIAWCVGDETRVLARRQMNGLPEQIQVVKIDALLPVVRLLPDNDTLLLSEDEGGYVSRYSLARNQSICRFRNAESDMHGVGDLVLTPDGSQALVNANGQVAVWRTENCTRIRTILDEVDGHGTVIAMSPRGSRALIVNQDHMLYLLRTSDWTVEATFQIPASAIGHGGKLVFLNDGFLLSVGKDSALWIWDLERRRLAANLFLHGQENWVLVAPDGRFDASDLEDISGLAWYRKDRPLEGLPLEIFMRDYFEPGLLSKILSRQPLQPLPSPTTRSLIRPKIAIQAVTPQTGQPQFVDVSVRVTVPEDAEVSAGKAESVAELRLFREGMLVARADEVMPKVSPGASRTVVLKKIRLPAGPSAPSEVEFSAYAFNGDGIKSVTDRRSYRLPPRLEAAKRRAWIVTIGVDAYDDPRLKLGYAAQDAKRTRDGLEWWADQFGPFEEVVAVTLVSDGEGHSDATLERITAVFQVLAGQTVAPERLTGLAGASRLGSAGPLDLVFISFAGHGMLDATGQFWFLTQDTLLTEGSSALRNALSSQKLRDLLQGVDAGRFLMLIDACHSAGTVADPEFKPGPFASRGLGQLAFDKQMQILVSSQASEVSLESATLKGGLLTYAAVTEGLLQRKAVPAGGGDKITPRDLFSYVVGRMPGLAEMVTGRKVSQAEPQAEGRGVVRLNGSKTAARPAAVQQPVVFDFYRGRRVTLGE